MTLFIVKNCDGAIFGAYNNEPDAIEAVKRANKMWGRWWGQLLPHAEFYYGKWTLNEDMRPPQQ